MDVEVAMTIKSNALFQTRSINNELSLLRNRQHYKTAMFFII